MKTTRRIIRLHVCRPFSEILIGIVSGCRVMKTRRRMILAATHDGGIFSSSRRKATEVRALLPLLLAPRNSGGRPGGYLKAWWILWSKEVDIGDSLQGDANRTNDLPGSRSHGRISYSSASYAPIVQACRPSTKLALGLLGFSDCWLSIAVRALTTFTTAGLVYRMVVLLLLLNFRYVMVRCNLAVPDLFSRAHPRS